MKALLTRTALVSALLVTITGAQAASMDFEVSDSDTIVVGATAEKVTLRVTGYKNLAPSEMTASNVKLGTYYVSTSSSVGELAVTYGKEHNAKVDSVLIGIIKNDTGEERKTWISPNGGGTGKYVEVDGTTWVYPATSDVRSYQGEILTRGNAPLFAGVYPITLRAALYQP